MCHITVTRSKKNNNNTFPWISHTCTCIQAKIHASFYIIIKSINWLLNYIGNICYCHVAPYEYNKTKPCVTKANLEVLEKCKQASSTRRLSPFWLWLTLTWIYQRLWVAAELCMNPTQPVPFLSGYRMFSLDAQCLSLFSAPPAYLGWSSAFLQLGQVCFLSIRAM